MPPPPRDKSPAGQPPGSGDSSARAVHTYGTAAVGIGLLVASKSGWLSEGAAGASVGSNSTADYTRGQQVSAEARALGTVAICALGVGAVLSAAARSASQRPPKCCPTGLPSPYKPAGLLFELIPVVWNLSIVLVCGSMLTYAARLACETLTVALPFTLTPPDTTQEQVTTAAVGLVAVLLLGYFRRAAFIQAIREQQHRSSSASEGVQSPIAAPGSHIVVIGAGPSGLIAAKYLLERGHKVTVFESELDIGGTFRYRAYEHAVQVSSKYITTFCDLRLPDAEDHLPIPAYIEYLEDFCRKFGLRSVIEFGTFVSSVNRRSTAERAAGAPEYAVTVRTAAGGQGTVEAAGVVVCSGLHLSPLIPKVPGMEDFTGEVLHSAQYKQRGQLAGKQLLVIGAGETGMDLCYHGICQPGGAKSVTLSTKSGFLSVPSCLPNGLPLDIFISNIFECCYEHRWVEKFHLKWKASTVGIRSMLWLFSGSSTGYNQWACSKPDVARGWHFINKSARAMAAINAPIKGSWASFPWNLAQAEVEMPVTAVDQVNRFVSDGKGGGYFVTESGRILTGVDMVVFATGYRQTFPFLDRPTDMGGNHELPSQRLVVDEDEPNLAFIGFARPNVGAIPPIAEMQVMWWLSYISGGIALPLREQSYRLLSKSSAKAVAYGVDHGAYMHQLGKDFGGAPSLGWLVRKGEVKAAIAYALGQSFTPFFRLQGPFASEHSMQVTRGELFSTIVRRGVGGNLMFGSIAAVFGVLNLAAEFVDLLLSAVGLHLLPVQPNV